MAKVITFSRTYPAYHKKAGEPTWFVEKFLKSIQFEEAFKKVFDFGTKIRGVSHTVYSDCEPKHHTVRIGRRWKAGDYFSPRVWGSNVNVKNGRTGPYQSDQIEITPPTLITHTYDLLLYKHLQLLNDGGNVIGSHIWISSEKTNQMLYDDNLSLIAGNDGLNLDDFKDWILKPILKGKNDVIPAQIICWNKAVDYDNHPDWLPF